MAVTPDDNDLTLQPPDGKRRARRPPAKKTPEEKLASDSLTVRLEGYFQIGYQRTWSVPYYQTSVAEDRGHFKRMGEQLGEEMARALIDDFMLAVRPVSKGGDPKLQLRYPNVRALNTSVQYLLTRRRDTPMSERTASNVHELRRATGRGE